MGTGLEKWCIALGRELQEELTAVAHMTKCARFFSEVQNGKLRGEGHILLSSA